MRFQSGKEFLSQPAKSVTILGMSGVGKTTLAAILRKAGWFQYSVDYRIGTKYMDEHIADNFKREAMRVPLLRELLCSDSIYIRSNITFDNLSPLSTYLGKPGNPALGGIPFGEYKRRQAQHREAEIHALKDVPEFIARAREIYGYTDFVCDCGGSVCEVTDAANPADPALAALTASTLLLYIEGTAEHTKMLVDRFRKHPKPMYYQPAFLEAKWAEYKALNKISDDNAVDPDGFAAWGFEQLLHHRLPLYRAIAARHGYTVSMAEAQKVHSAQDFTDLVAKAIGN
jgi:hypothetical protein